MIEDYPFFSGLLIGWVTAFAFSLVFVLVAVRRATADPPKVDRIDDDVLRATADAGYVTLPEYFSARRDGEKLDGQI